MLLEMQIRSISYFPTSDLWNKYSGRTTSLEMDICFSSFAPDFQAAHSSPYFLVYGFVSVLQGLNSIEDFGL